MRPKIMNESVRLNINIEKEMHMMLKDYAKSNDVKVLSIIRDALDEYFENHYINDTKK